jgi:hypothetical protein
MQSVRKRSLSVRVFGLEHSEVYCRQQPNMAQGAAENSIFLTVTYEVGLQANRHDDNSCGCAVMMMQRKS